MALKDTKFTYKFEDGYEMTIPKFTQLPFKAFRTLQKSEKSGDEQEHGEVMMDVFLSVMDKATSKKVEDQPFTEVMDAVQAWFGADVDSDEVETEADPL